MSGYAGVDAHANALCERASAGNLQLDADVCVNEFLLHESGV